MSEGAESRVLELAALLCDELISPEEFAELDEVLATNGEAREAYRGFLALHQQLEGGALECPEPCRDREPQAQVDSSVAVTTGLAEPAPGDDRGLLEERIRKAERRMMWSMAACVVATAVVLALLFGPESESETQVGMVGLEENSAGRARGRDDERGAAAAREPRDDFSSALVLPATEEVSASELRTAETGAAEKTGARPPQDPVARNMKVPAVPPLPPAGSDGALAGSDRDAGPVGESPGGFLLRDAASNDTFQMLAKRAGKQYFHNSKIAGSEFNVSGQLNGDDPEQQMEELAFQHGLTL